MVSNRHKSCIEISIGIAWVGGIDPRTDTRVVLKFDYMNDSYKEDDLEPTQELYWNPHDFTYDYYNQSSNRHKSCIEIIDHKKRGWIGIGSNRHKSCIEIKVFFRYQKILYLEPTQELYWNKEFKSKQGEEMPSNRHKSCIEIYQC